LGEGLGWCGDKIGDIGDSRLTHVLVRFLVGGRLGVLHYGGVGELDVLGFGEGNGLHGVGLGWLLLVHFFQLGELLVIEGPYFIHLLHTLSPDLLHFLLNHVAEILCLRILHQKLLLRAIILLFFFDDFHLLGTVDLELGRWGEHGSALVVLAVVVFFLVGVE